MPSFQFVLSRSQRVSPPPASLDKVVESEATRSAWNEAGTWEEVEKTEWCKGKIIKALRCGSEECGLRCILLRDLLYTFRLLVCVALADRMACTSRSIYRLQASVVSKRKCSVAVVVIVTNNLAVRS